MDQALRPMSTAQVLDRTFFLYRRNFWLFAGIGMVPPAFVLVAQLFILAAPKGGNNLAGSVAGIAAISMGAIVGVIVYLIGYALATGASVYAVSNAHLGKTSTISQSYWSVSNRVGAIIGTSICTGLVVGLVVVAAIAATALLSVALAKAMGGVSTVIMIPVWGVEIFLLIKFALRYSLAVPACVLEKLGPVESLKRSFALARGSEGRIFLIFLLFAVIIFVLSLVFSLPILVGIGVAAAKGSQPPIQYQIAQLFARFMASTLSGPISIIALSLIYYDQRVRKEAFDLQLMMEAVGHTPPQAAAASAGASTSIG
jgi:hypothetical protein